MVQLDGLRAFAVLCTMVTHFTNSTDGWLRYFPWGQLGVQLFFVLSGFLITGILLKNREERDNFGMLWRFYAKRFLRIFPAFYATLGMAALLNLRGVRQSVWWHFTYLSNVYFATHNVPASGVTHFWSLAVEEQFYLFWPFLILFLPAKYLPRMMVTAFFIAPFFRLACLLIGAPKWAMLPFGCLDTLAAGAILALLWNRRLGSPEFLRHLDRYFIWIALPPFILFLAANAFAPHDERGLVWANTAMALFFGWLVNRAGRSFVGPVGALLEWRPIVYVGKISYGVYLIHPFMASLLFHTLKFLGWSWPSGSPQWVGTLIALSIAAASASWYLFEGRINSLKRYFEYPRKFEHSPARNDAELSSSNGKSLIA